MAKEEKKKEPEKPAEKTAGKEPKLNEKVDIMWKAFKSGAFKA